MGKTIEISFRRAALFVAGAFLLTEAPEAQTYFDRSGTTINGVAPAPYDYWPLGPGQHNLSLASATPLVVPAGARMAILCASTATVRYTTDGLTTPTNSVGQPLTAGTCTQLSGVRVLANFRAASSSGTLDIEYFQ